MYIGGKKHKKNKSIKYKRAETFSKILHILYFSSLVPFSFSALNSSLFFFYIFLICFCTCSFRNFFFYSSIFLCILFALVFLFFTPPPSAFCLSLVFFPFQFVYFLHYFCPSISFLQVFISRPVWQTFCFARLHLMEASAQCVSVSSLLSG